MVILSNTIRYNSYHGVYLNNGADAFLGYNTITNNCSNGTQAGVYCINNSDPFMRSAAPAPDYGNNYIHHNNGAGVKAIGTSYPSLGINFQQGTLKDYYGYNEIHNNGGYEVDNRNTSGTIMAECNYWSADHNVQANPSDVYGSVDYTPVLPENPNVVAGGNGRALLKSSIDFEEAVALENQGEFQSAADIYLKFLQADPDADNAGFGVSGLIRCYKGMERRREIPAVMDQFINDFPQTALAESAKAHSLPYLVQYGNHDTALSRVLELLSQKRNDAEAEPSLLFQTAGIYRLKSAGRAGDDFSNAQNTYQELIQKYPDSDFAFFARMDLEELGGSVLGRHATESNPNTLSQKSFELKANYPNPFNPQTVIRFHLTDEQPVQLRIFDAAGRLVRALAEKSYPKGEYAISWDGKDDRGLGVVSGIYFYKLIVGQQSQTRKMVLLH